MAYRVKLILRALQGQGLFRRLDRDELTDEWKKRGVRKQREYAILTAEISKATFGLAPSWS